MECPTALCSVAGATTTTSPSFISSVRSARSPGASTPSSLGSRMRTARSLPLQLLPPQDVVAVWREAVGLVAHVREEPQSRRVPAEAQRLGVARPVHPLLALRQRD